MTTPNDIGELVQLLPFYVSGTLNSADTARVDAGLAISPELRVAFAEEENFLRQCKIQGKQMVDGSTDPEVRLDAVLSHLPPQISAMSAVVTPPRPPLQNLLAFLNPAHWHPSVSLALALAVLAQAGWIANGLHTPGQMDYHTVSGPDDHPLGDGPMLIIRPQDTASWSAIEGLLAREELSVLAGPDEGRITVRADAPKVDLKALAERLRASPDVAFVGEVQ